MIFFFGHFIESERRREFCPTAREKLKSLRVGTVLRIEKK